MAIKWLDAKRLQGTNAERLALTTGYTDGNGLNGTATAITVDTDDEPSFTTGCYEFNGSTSKVTIADSLLTTACSLSLWFNSNTTSGAQSCYGQTGAINNNLYLYSSKVRFSTSGSASQIGSTNTWSTGDWYNLIITKTADTGSGDAVVTMYLNNNLEVTQADWEDFSASASSLISGNQTDYFSGFLSDFAVWNTVISADTRLAINGINPPDTGALISSLSDKANITTYYPFTSLDGSTVTNMATAVYPNLPNGTIFNETDTYKYFMFDGTDTWNQMVSS